MSVPITTRTAKGSPLLTAEMDANLTALQSGIDTVLAGIEASYAFDPAATVAQIAAAAARGVSMQFAASTGKQSFRNGVVSSSALTGVATFTRTTARTAFDQSGALQSYTTGTPALNGSGLSIYEAHTERCLQNNTFSNAAWTKTNATVTAAAAVAPDGTTTAWKLAEDATAAAQHYIVQSISGMIAGEARTSGVFAKYGGRQYLALYNSSGPTQAWFDLINGAVSNTSAGTTAYMIPLGNGWYFCAISQPTGSAGASDTLEIHTASTAGSFSYTGDGTSGVYIWTASNRAKASPILDAQQTTTATVTGNADVVQEAVNIPVGQAFTVVGRAIAPFDDGGISSPRLFTLAAAGNTADVIQVYFQTAALRMQALSGGVAATTNAQWAASGQAPVGFALSVSGSTITFSVNGGAVQTATLPGGPFAQALTRLNIGSFPTPSAYWNSTIRDLNITMRAMSSAELVAASDVSLERDLDFTTQTYKYLGDTYSAGVTDLPLTTFSRASVANGLTVAGWLLSYASGGLRASDAGLTIEPAATNAALWCRDLTNAVWVGTNMTAAKDQSGADGVSSSASSILATAANATILQTITLASSQRAQSAFVKRLIGAGAVSMTTDGGATWTVITVGASWAQVSIPAQTLANPQVGFKLATSGDKIAVDFVQNEGGSYATSPMLTTAATASRNSEALISNDAAPSAFSVQAEVTIPAANGANARVWQWDDGTAANYLTLYYVGGHLKLQQRAASGSFNDVLDLGAVAVGSTYKVALAFAANDFAGSMNGGAVVTSAAFSIPAGLNTFRFGMDSSTNAAWGPGLRKIKRWRGRRTNAQLIADST